MKLLDLYKLQIYINIHSSYCTMRYVYRAVATYVES